MTNEKKTKATQTTKPAADEKDSTNTPTVNEKQPERRKPLPAIRAGGEYAVKDGELVQTKKPTAGHKDGDRARNKNGKTAK